MQVDLGLSELDAQTASQAFDSEVAAKLRSYLQNECVLDLAGTNRVMTLLKKIYINGVRLLHAKTSFTAAELLIESPGQQPSQEIIDSSRQITEYLGQAIADNLVSAQMALLYSAAAQLASHDEKIHPRPRN